MKPLKPVTSLILVSLILAACGSPTPTAVVNTQAVEPTAAATTAATQPAASDLYNEYYFATLADYQAATGNSLTAFHEAPSLADQVAAGSLPPLDQRLPQEPAIVRTREGSAAQYGSEMHLLGFFEGAGVFSQFTEDTQQGLIAWDVSYRAFYPNIAKGWELSEDSQTLRLFLFCNNF